MNVFAAWFLWWAVALLIVGALLWNYGIMITAFVIFIIGIWFGRES